MFFFQSIKFGLHLFHGFCTIIFTTTGSGEMEVLLIVGEEKKELKSPVNNIEMFKTKLNKLLCKSLKPLIQR